MTATPPPLATPQHTQNESNEAQASSEFKCQQCAALLKYAPGTGSLKCDYCHHHNVIPICEEDIEELDFHAYLKTVQNEVPVEERLVLNCNACGAESTAEKNVTAHSCPFCDTDIVSTEKSVRLIKPRSLLPFKVTQSEAKKSYINWLSGLWFAPSELKKKAKLDIAVNGVYVPHWTYDADTISYYTGQRGEHYYVTETKTRTDSEGKTEQYTESVRKTRWWSVSGTVFEEFDDVLVLASESLPSQYTQALAPWDLNNLVGYKDDYLSGFKAESYQVSLSDGFESAKSLMDASIRRGIRCHIGGDEQRIHSVKTQHKNVTFKHILLPVWLSAFRYKEKVYRFMINARTGEVQGERPWSWMKITLSILGVVGMLAGGYFGVVALQKM